jgi:hypothetical protein
MTDEFDTGKLIQLAEILTQEYIDEMQLEGRRPGEIVDCGITTEKIPWCNVPSCPNYKLLQIGE